MMKSLSVIISDSLSETENSLRQTGHDKVIDFEEEEEEEEEFKVMRSLTQDEQKEWRQERVMMGRVKMLRQTGHVRMFLSDSISFFGSLDLGGSDSCFWDD